MPRRTCLGCRNVYEKSSLIRLVSDAGRLKPDFSGGKEGRGAYLCLRKECVKEAYKKKESFSRALRCKVVLPDPEGLWLSISGPAESNH